MSDMSAKQLHKEFKSDIKRFEKEFKTDIKIYQVRICHEYSYHEKCQRYWIYGYGLGNAKIAGDREYCHFDMVANVSTLCADSALTLYNKIKNRFDKGYIVNNHNDDYCQFSIDLSALDEIAAYYERDNEYQLIGKLNCTYDINEYDKENYTEEGCEVGLNCILYSPMTESDIEGFSNKYGVDVEWIE